MQWYLNNIQLNNKSHNFVCNCNLVLRYLVDNNWFTHWRRYIGFDSDQYIVDSELDLFVAGTLEDHPGPIDNVNLFKGNIKQVNYITTCI